MNQEEKDKVKKTKSFVGTLARCFWVVIGILISVGFIMAIVKIIEYIKDLF